MGVTLKSLELGKTKVTTYTICLGIILFTGFILRIYGNDFALPSVPHPDERTLVNHAIRMVQKGDLNPHFFAWPSLLIYVCAIIFKLEYILEGMGLIQVDRSMLYLTGRYLGAVAGTLTLLIVYYIGKNLYNKNTGIVAAAFLMAMPLAVKHSHYIAADIPVTFFITLSFLFASLILKTGAKKYYIFAGVAAGLAASTKYNGGLILLPIFIAHLLFIQKNTIDNKFKNIFLSKNLFFSISLAGLTYLITTPYTLLDFKKFWHDFTFETSHVTIGHGVAFIGTAPGWIYHFETSLKQGMTYKLEILSTLGVIYILLLASGYVISRKRFESRSTNIQGGILLLSWVLPYYLIVGSWEVKFTRYVLPLLPFLALLGANLLVDAVEYLMQIVAKFVNNVPVLKTMVISLIAIALIITPVQDSIKIGEGLSEEYIGLVALQWMDENIPKGSTIIREQYAPECGLIEDVKCKSYGYRLASRSHDDFIEIGANYIAVSSLMYGAFRSHPNESAKQIQFYDSLDERYELVKVFKKPKGQIGPEEIKIYRIDTVSMAKPGGFREDFANLFYWGADLNEKAVLRTDRGIATYQTLSEDQSIDVDFSTGLYSKAYPYFETRIKVLRGKISIGVYDSTGKAHMFLNNFTTDGEWVTYKFNLYDWLSRNGYADNVYGIIITDTLDGGKSFRSQIDWISIHNSIFWDVFEDESRIAGKVNVTIVSGGTALSNVAADLLSNNGFEDSFKGWRPHAKWSIDNEESHSGNKSAVLYGTVDPAHDASAYLDTKVYRGILKPNTPYRFSAWIKGNVTDAVKGPVRQFGSADPWSRWVSFTRDNKEYSNWTYSEGIITTPDDINGNFLIRIYGGGNPAVWIDDVSFDEEVYEPSGTLTSTTTNTKNSIVSVTPAWTSTESDGKNITIEISVDNGTTWTRAKNGVPINYTASDSNRHMLYRAFFQTGNVRQSPVLHDITLTYKEP